MIYCTTEQIFSRKTFLETPSFGTDGSPLFSSVHSQKITVRKKKPMLKINSAE
jgi:hypothetical protein